MQLRFRERSAFIKLCNFFDEKASGNAVRNNMMRINQKQMARRADGEQLGSDQRSGAEIKWSDKAVDLCFCVLS